MERRPQAAEFLPRSVVIVAPTSLSSRAATFRPKIEIKGKTTRVLVEQQGAVDISHRGKLIGHVDSAEQWEIDDALRLILALG